MSFEVGLRALLMADSGISGIVGAQIYPVILEEGATLPALVYQRISGPRVQSLDGASGLAVLRIAISCYSTLFATVRDLASKVRVRLNGYRGTLSEGTVVGGALLLDERDIFSEPVRIFRTDLDFQFFVEE